MKKPKILNRENLSVLYNKYYKILLIVPLTIAIISLIYLGTFFSNNNDFMYRDTSLAGGTTITLNGDLDSEKLDSLKEDFPDLTVRKLTDIGTSHTLASILETSVEPNEIQPKLEKLLGFNLTKDNSSIEFSGPTLSQGFYKQLIIALIIAFLLISLVVFLLFKTLTPSLAIIFSIFSDLVVALAIIDFFEIKLSAAGISAFLMLIGYSVDTNILLTTRALKNTEGTLNSRIFHAFRTGILMTITALTAIIPAFLLITGLPDSFRQIFLILAVGLSIDVINTWFMNAGIIKFYCQKRGIN